MSEVLLINLNGPRFVVCAGCGNEIVDENCAVSIDDCGEPTNQQTGACRATCRAFHDMLYGLGTSMGSCPSINQI